MRGQFNLAGSRWLKALQVVLVAACTTGGLGPLFAQVADRVIIAAFAQMDEAEAQQWAPSVVRLNDRNEVVTGIA
jgi:aspartate 1-decarboxylase